MALATLALAAVPANAATITVGPGGNLQTAINAARRGDTIVLTAGATYTGTFTLPVPPAGSGFITIRTAPDARLPVPGKRIQPALHAPLLAKIRSGSTSPAIVTAPGAHHWRLELLEIGPNPAGGDDMIRLGRGGSDQTTLGAVAHDLVIDRCYIHGDPLTAQKRGIALNSASTTIVNSHIAEIKASGIDSQAICGWNGPGPFVIENNYLEAAGENVMFGGADPKIPGLVPSDITIRLNHVAKPLAWRQTGQWTVKNLLELKNARRVLIEGNVFEYSWIAAQGGLGIVMTPRNQDGTAPWSVVSEVTFRYNIVRHTAGGMSVNGFDTNYPSLPGRNIRIEHNLFVDVTSTAGRLLIMGNRPENVTIEHNTHLQSGTVVFVHGQNTDGTYDTVAGFRFANNLGLHNNSGIVGEGAGGYGLASIRTYFGSESTVVRNVIAGALASRYPSDNFFPTVAAFMAEFEAGTYRLRAASPYRNAGTDGKDLGADMNQLEALTSQALSGSTGPPVAPTNLRVTR